MASTTIAATSPSIVTTPLAETGRPRRAAASRPVNVSPSPTAASAVTSTSTRSRPRISRSNSRALPSPEKTVVALGSPESSAIAMSRAPSSSSASASVAAGAVDASVPPPATTPLANGGRGLKRRQSAASVTSEDKRRRLSDGEDTTDQNPGEIASVPAKLTLKFDHMAAPKPVAPVNLRFVVGKSSRQSASPTKPNGVLPSEPATPSVPPSQPPTEPPTRANSVEPSSETALLGTPGLAAAQTVSAVPSPSPAAPAKGKYAKRNSRRPLKRGEVDPDDPVAVAKQRERHALIDKAIEDIDLQIKLIQTDGGHPSITAMLAELEKRYNKQMEQTNARYLAALGDLKKSRGFSRQQAHVDFMVTREDLVESMTTENRRAIARARQERTHLAVVPNTYPLLRDGQGGGGWIVHDDRLVSKGTFPTVPVMLDDEQRERLDLSVDVRAATSEDTASDLRRIKDAVAGRTSRPETRSAETSSHATGQSSSHDPYGLRQNSYSSSSAASTPGVAAASSSSISASAATHERTRQAPPSFPSNSEGRSRQERSSQRRPLVWETFNNPDASRLADEVERERASARAATSSASTSSTSSSRPNPGASIPGYGHFTSVPTYHYSVPAGGSSTIPGASSASSRDSTARTAGAAGSSSFSLDGKAAARARNLQSGSSLASASAFSYWPTSNRSREDLYGTASSSSSTAASQRDRELEAQRERDRLRVEREDADRRLRERAAKDAELARERRQREDEQARERDRERQHERDQAFARWSQPRRPGSVLDSHPSSSSQTAGASSSASPAAGSIRANPLTSLFAPLPPIRTPSGAYASTAIRDARPSASTTNGASSSTSSAEAGSSRLNTTSTSLVSRLYSQRDSIDDYDRVRPKWDALWSHTPYGKSRDDPAGAARPTGSATASAPDSARSVSASQSNGPGSAARANGVSTSLVATSAVPASTSAREVAAGDRRLDATSSARPSSSLSGIAGSSGSGLTSSKTLPPLPPVSSSSTSSRSGSDYFSKYGAGSYGSGASSVKRPFSASYLYGLGPAPPPPPSQSSSSAASSSAARRPAANGDEAASRPFGGQKRDGGV